jgi:hypothetical protein
VKKLLLTAALLTALSAPGFASSNGTPNTLSWPIYPRVEDHDGMQVTCMLAPPGWHQVDGNGKPWSTPVDDDGRPMKCTPYTELGGDGKPTTCTVAPQGIKQAAGELPTVRCHKDIFDDFEATLAKPKLECDKMPSWLGVLLCRWDTKS